MHRALALAALVVAVQSPTVVNPQPNPDLTTRVGYHQSRRESTPCGDCVLRHRRRTRPICTQRGEALRFCLHDEASFRRDGAGDARRRLSLSHKDLWTGSIDRHGTLRGDLILVASGDPNLSQRMLPDGSLAFENHDHWYGGSPDTRAVPGDPLVVIRQLATQVAAHGITRIRGRVLVDATLYPEGTRELGTGVIVSPISVNDNVLDVTIGPGDAVNAPGIITVSPQTAYVRFVNKVTMSAADGREDLYFDDGRRERRRVAHGDGARYLPGWHAGTPVRTTAPGAEQVRAGGAGRSLARAGGHD